MANKKNRIDTAKLFENMVTQEKEEEEKKPAEKERGITQERGIREKPKSTREKNVQVSIYLRPDQAKELRIQDAMKEKENDKSAIARMGIDIVLEMRCEVYNRMKAKAATEGISSGELVEKALIKYLNR